MREGKRNVEQIIQSSYHADQIKKVIQFQVIGLKAQIIRVDVSAQPKFKNQSQVKSVKATPLDSQLLMQNLTVSKNYTGQRLSDLKNLNYRRLYSKCSLGEGGGEVRGAESALYMSIRPSRAGEFLAGGSGSHLQAPSHRTQEEPRAGQGAGPGLGRLTLPRPPRRPRLERRGHRFRKGHGRCRDSGAEARV